MGDHRGSTHSTLSCATNTLYFKVTPEHHHVHSNTNSVPLDIFARVSPNESVPGCGMELRHSVPPSPGEASRCSVAGRRGSARCLHALLCNRWKHTRTHTHTHAAALRLSLCDSDALRVHAGALPLHILYIWTCARKLSSFPPALFSQTRPRSESTKALCCAPRRRGEPTKNGLEPLPRRLAGHLWQPKRLQSYGTNARSGETWEKGSAAGRLSG